MQVSDYPFSICSTLKEEGLASLTMQLVFRAMNFITAMGLNGIGAIIFTL